MMSALKHALDKSGKKKGPRLDKRKWSVRRTSIDKSGKKKGPRLDKKMVRTTDEHSKSCLEWK